MLSGNAIVDDVSVNVPTNLLQFNCLLWDSRDSTISGVGADPFPSLFLRRK
jgi:hypothetical protein